MIKRVLFPGFPLLAVSLAAVAVCSYGLGREFHIQRQGRAYYAALSVTTGNHADANLQSKYDSNLLTALEPDTNRHLDNDGINANRCETAEKDAGATALCDFSEENSLATEPNWTPYVDFDTLSKTIPDLAAWIQWEGMEVDYPVVQGADNQHYLSRLPDGRANKMGSIFLDYRNKADFSDKNSLIYGHHVKSGAMFGVLENYREQAFYDEYPTVMLHVPGKQYEVALFSGYVADAAQETLPLDFTDASDFIRYISEIGRRSVFKCDVEVSADDRLVTFCTCAYDFSNARFVLVGKLMEPAAE